MAASPRKLMILGAGVFQVPAIRKAQAMGIQVISISNLRNDPGHAIADKYFPISTLDKEAVMQIALLERISGIITIASEVAAPTAAWVSEKLYLPGYPYNTAITIGNKLLLRQFLAKKGLSRVRFGDASSYAAAMASFKKLPLPLMLKPLLSSGSRGIRLISNEHDMEQYLPEALANSFIFKGALLEEYVTGTAVGGSLLVSEGKIIAAVLSQKFVNDRFVTTGHIMPPLVPNDQISQVIKVAEKLVAALKLDNGALDLDLVLTEQGPEIIELGGRLGGNAVAELAGRHTGFDFVDAAIRIAMGEALAPVQLQHNPVAVHIIGSEKAGILGKLHRFSDLFPQEAAHLLAQNDFVQPGSPVHAYTQGNFQLGNILLTAPTTAQLLELLTRVQHTNWAEVE